MRYIVAGLLVDALIAAALGMLAVAAWLRGR
jgi:hypothetical protein